MKPLILILLVTVCLTSFAQQKRFTIQAKVVDPKGDPISDVYIINLVSNEKYISQNNGVCNIMIHPSDSIILSHISFFRKIVSIHDILRNPIITLFSEDIDIPEVKVTPKQHSDNDLALKNMMFLKEYDVPAFTKIKEENEPITAITTEHNDLMRTEASSLSLVRFSPSESIEKLFVKLKKKDTWNDNSSTKKQLKDVKEE